MKKWICILLCLSLICSGCGSSISYQAEALSAEYHPKDVEETNMGALGPVITDFGIRLLQQSFDAEKNTLISPLSVITALSMTANGAKGDTLAQMEAVLGGDIQWLNRYLHGYLDQIAGKTDTEVHIANSIWFKDSPDLTVKETFLQTNADYYGAGIFRAAFDQGTLRDINSWVENNTDGMIDHILDKIPDEAVMYLINALVFDAKWQEVYKEHQVRDGEFTTESGDIRKVSLMFSTEHSYLETEYASGFMKYYEGGRYAFAALLPNEGTTVEELITSLSGEDLDALLRAPQDIIVYARMPKFETDYSAELSELLIAMGMADAFDWTVADFSGLGETTDGTNICINRVLHKTQITVGEQGTRAGAATVVEMAAEGAMEPEETRTVILDRPFLYMIIDCEFNQPLFIGALMDPG